MSFLCTIVIVMYHSQVGWQPFEVSYEAHMVMEAIFELIASLAMAFFFMKSGYLLYFNASADSIKEKMRSRLHSLAIPFLLWNTVYMLVFLVIKQEYPASLLELADKFTLHPWDGPLWYLFALLLLTLFLPLGVRLKNRKKPCICWLVALWAASAVLYCWGAAGSRQPLLAWCVRLLRYLPAYCIGAAAGLLKPGLIAVSIHSKTVRRIGCGLLALFFAVCCASPFLPAPQLIGRFLLMNAVLLSALLIWMLLPAELFRRKSAVCRNVFFIYAFHGLMIPAAHPLLVKLLHALGCPFAAAALLVPAGCAGLVYAAAWICELLAKRLRLEKPMALLTGGR